MGARTTGTEEGERTNFTLSRIMSCLLLAVLPGPTNERTLGAQQLDLQEVLEG